MQLNLKLVPFNSNAPRRETAAWFVRGRNPQDWLRELNSWNLPVEWLELRSIPQSFGDAMPMGVLVTWPALTDNRQSATSRSLQFATHHAQPYGRIADRLFIPIDAGFFPDVDANDLLSLLPPDDSEFLWHPSAGLIRIEAIERLQIIDLLAAPPKRQRNWNCAVPGISFNSRLISVEPDVPVTPDKIFEEEASDIGSQQDSLEDLPPTSDEFLQGKLNNLMKRFRDAMKSLKSGSKPPSSKNPNDANPPETSGTGNPLANLGGHASSLIAKAATLAGKGFGLAFQPLSAAGSVAGKALSAMGASSLIDKIARNREIDRLINLLKKDPDIGLKFALSMGGGNEGHRGTANPSNALGARDVGFDLNRLFGGRPADRWDIRRDQQQTLIQQYRELAAREIRLGRHRRAAYIYAELLGDLVSAAGALESGHHYREAAVIWRDKLKRPLEAARCLERAGFLDQAANLYIETGNFEKAAEIYVRLGRPDEAEQLLRNWVESLLSRGDYLAASRILLDKLNDIDGALQALFLGWPSSPMALECLKQSFQSLGTNARHEQALSLVAKLKDQPFNGQITKLLARGLSESAIKYPDVAVREAAGDATRIVVSRVLKTSDRADTTALLEAIRNLAPQDRLLFRDTNRYFRIRHESGKPKERSSNSYGIRFTNSFALSLKGTTWKVARSASDTVYVAGYANDSFILKRLKWNNLNDQTHRVLGPRVNETKQLILEPFPDDAGPPILHPSGIEHLRLQQWSQDEPKMFPAGSPSWGTKSTVALTYSEGGFGWRIRDIFGQLELACFSPRGEPLFSMKLPIPRDPLQERLLQITIQVVNGVLWLGYGKSLYSINNPERFASALNNAKNTDSDVRINELDLKSEIQSLVVRPFDGNACLVALFDIGGCVVNEHGQSLVAMDCEAPVATFLSDGRLIIASETEVCAYDIVKSRPVKIGGQSLRFKPISVTPTNKLSEFAVFGRKGEIVIFEIEGG